MLLKLSRSESWLLSADSAYSRSFSVSLPSFLLSSGSAAAMTARWMDAYSLADEKAASARVRCDHLGVAGRLRHVLREVEQLGDETVVGLDRLGRVVLVLVGVAADLAEVAQLADETDQAVADTAGGSRPRWRRRSPRRRR